MHRWLLICSLALAAPLAGQPQLPVPLGMRADLVFEELSGGHVVHGFATGLEDGELYVAVGRHVIRYRDGEDPEIIHEFIPGNSAGMLMRPPGQNDLFYSDFSFDILFRRDMSSGAEEQLLLPRFTFDIAVSQDGEVYASANPNFFRPGARSGIYRIHSEGVAPEKIIDFDGPSGPIAFDADGFLYYATQSSIFPTPPGSVKILRFDQFRSRRALRSRSSRTEFDGLPPVTGVELVAALDGAFDLSFDDRGRMYVSDPNGGGLLRTHERSFLLDPVPLIAPSNDLTLQLQYVRGQRAEFAAYQPDRGARLLVSVATFGITRIWSITTERPVLTSLTGNSAGPGTIELAVNGLPIAGQPTFLFASTAPRRREQALLHTAGLPLWFGLDPSAHLLSWSGQTNANGQATFMVPYAGGLDMEIHFQAITRIDLPPFEDYLASTAILSIRLHL